MIDSADTVLITGGTGSFGYQMTSRLLNEFDGMKVKIYSRDEDKHREMQNYFNNENLSFVLGDLRDYERLCESFKNVDVVLHAGALKQIPQLEFNPYEAIKTNTLSAVNVMKACDVNNVKQLIAISTDKACKPVNSYGMTKALMEKIIIGDDIQGDTKFGCVRYGNVLGSRGSVLPVWNKLIQERKPIPITSFKMRRFFLTLQQATDLILFASNNLNNNEIFVSKAPSLYIKDLAKVYAYLETGDDNYPQTEIGIRAGEKLDEMLISEEEMSHTDDMGNYYKINRPDRYSHKSVNVDFSSANAKILNKDDIMNLIKDLEWKK